MKKNIGAQLALYPMPVTVIGAMNGDKPTWTLVAHVGIIGWKTGEVLGKCLSFKKNPNE